MASIIKRGVALAALTLALFAGSSVTAEAQTVVVNFDDLLSLTTVPDGYGGINWDGEWKTLNQPGFPPQSKPINIFNIKHVANAPFEFVTPSEFKGAYVSGTNQSSVKFQMYLSGSLVATSSVLTPTTTPTFLSSGYTGLVDKVVVIDSGDAQHFTLDDITYVRVAVVPEPGTVGLMAGAMIPGAALIRRRRTNRG